MSAEREAEADIDVLAAALREARTSRLKTPDEFGAMIGYSGAHVGNVERGHRPPTAEYLRAVDRKLQTGGLYSRMAERLGAPVWFRDWIAEERRASVLRWYEPAWIPGLLQTESYARATLADEHLTPAKVDQIITSRMSRQAILGREEPPLLLAVIDEAAISRVSERQRAAMAEQIRHLAELAQSPFIQVQIVPMYEGLYAGLGGPILIAESADGGRVVCAEHQLGAEVSARPEDVVTLEKRWGRVSGHALSREESLGRIKKAVELWT